jgi:hypothetical protein
MRTSFFFIILSLLLFNSCGDDNHNLIYDYHITITQPDNIDKHLGENIPIQVKFNSGTGEEIHHINIRIFNQTTHQVVYDKPNDPHLDVPETYTFSDTFTLAAASGLSEGLWVLEAKVWGHEDGVEETTDSVVFHIVP